MTAHNQHNQDSSTLLRTRAAAEDYIGAVCFKTGPPRWHGVELEWTTHHRDDLTRPLDLRHLADTLGAHAPPTIRPETEHRPLPRGCVVSVEPGGQIEISTPPCASLAQLWDTASSDADTLTTLLAQRGIVLGESGADPHRPPRRLLSVPRYAAMQRAFDRIGPSGMRMMCSTAAVQVCLDAGEPGELAARWQAAHALGPVLLAMFANSPRMGGSGTTWASTRMRAVLATDPPRSRPSRPARDPVTAWAHRVLDTPLLCVRREHGCWDAPAGVTFADWIAGALPEPPSTADLEYHASTMFPPVRPRGYLEVRYLDAQPGREWITPVAALDALLSNRSTVDQALAATEMTADRWIPAARAGLADPTIARGARDIADLAGGLLDRTGLPSAVTADIADSLHRAAAA